MHTMEISKPNVTKEELTRYLIIMKALTRYLLLEIVELILNATFAPYTIETILTNEDDDSMPLRLPLYYPLYPLDSYSNIRMPTMNTLIRKDALSTWLVIQTPHDKTPFAFKFHEHDKLPLNQLFKKTIDYINKEYGGSGIVMSLK